MKRIALTLISLFAIVSCSTTKLLPKGTYRLVSNKVAFDGEKLPSSDVTQYIRQQPNKGLIFGWSPALSIYNWSNGSGLGINRFWEAVGSEPVLFDPTLVQSSCDNIAGHLASIGYYGSEVHGEVEYKGRLAYVKYIVKAGTRYPIDEIVYEVPDGEFGQLFRADSANTTIHVGDYLSEKALEAETVRGAALFRNRGYYDFNKNHYFFEADTLTGKTTLYYRIRGYTRDEDASLDAPLRKYRIGEVNILHPEGIPFREALLRRYNRIRPGAIYNEQMINSTYNRLASLKVFNNVTIETTPTDSATVDCNIRLGGADQLGFKVNLEASTNASGLLGFSPQFNFFHKNLFHGGEWLDLGFTGNWQWIPNSSVSSTELGVSASLSIPRLLGYPIKRFRGDNIPRTDFKVSFNYQNRPEYLRLLSSFSFGYSGQMGRNYFYQISPFRVNIVKLSAISEDFVNTLISYPYLWDTFEDQIDAGVGLMLYHTTDPAVVPKGSYHAERLTLDLSGNVLSLLDPVLPAFEGIEGMHTIFGLPYKQYVRGEVNLSRVFRFGWNDVHALAMRMVAGAGLAYGNSVAMPFEKQFYAGGANSMRGWQARTLGPGTEQMNESFRIPSQTGNLKLEADLEYRFPAVWKLEGALFAEVGNVWEMGSTPMTWSSLAADWGVGVRLNLDFILIRLDAGFRIHDPACAEGERWVHPRDWLHGSSAIHFGVGYPF
ncbi:MAG: BamA/TamA family outer membrane protein [Bacteroidales bacterium]|nr:BamA/TamA family outer membrane protein [Bacteroidales bacterium]